MKNTEYMHQLGSNKSAIRELFAYGQMRAAQVGPDKVYDFSLGNPSVPAPAAVKEAILELLEEPSLVVHGYTAAQGDAAVRKAIADSINRKHQVNCDPDLLYMTCGAAASLCCCIRAITDPGDEWILFAPFFPEYRPFVEAAGGKVVVSTPNMADFQIDFADLESKINENTKALIINSPNNPSGVIYSPEVVEKLAALLEQKSAEYGHPIYIVADEPYVEIVYGEDVVPYVPEYYANTFVCYSYSKSLSLPGERIGYIYVSERMADAKNIYAGICGAGRSMGYVCAPSLFQKVIAKCVDVLPDVAEYKKNRDLLYTSLSEYGFECIKPQGAFYLFVKTPWEDSEKFCAYARDNHDLLLVPSDSFGVKGYMRISYCVSYDMIQRSLPEFEKLAKETM